MTRPIAIVGAGGFAREVLWMLSDCGVGAGVLSFHETDAYWHARDVAGLPVLPVSLLPPGADVVIAIGEPTARAALHAALPKGLNYPTFVHPDARIGPRVRLGEGTLVAAGCILTCDIEVQAQVQLNLATTVGHDCLLESFVTTAPAVNISGNCHLGERTYVGTNACLREGLAIPADTVIGMGAVLVTAPQQPGVYVGNPARRR